MTLDPGKHKSVLVKILKEIYNDASLAPQLGFKGGTAAALFHGLDRFSVDLDFDLLWDEHEEVIFVRMKDLLKHFGDLKEAYQKRYNLFYILAYDQKVAGAQNVKVEINRRQFGSAYEVKSFLGIAMQVMKQADMAAHKMCAMRERLGKTNRDIYDVRFFLANGWPVNKKIVEARMGMAYVDFLQDTIKAMEEFKARDMLAGMGELLNEKQKAWVKAKLKEETLFEFKLALEKERQGSSS